MHAHSAPQRREQTTQARNYPQKLLLPSLALSLFSRSLSLPISLFPSLMKLLRHPLALLPSAASSTTATRHTVLRRRPRFFSSSSSSISGPARLLSLSLLLHASRAALPTCPVPAAALPTCPAVSLRSSPRAYSTTTTATTTTDTNTTTASMPTSQEKQAQLRAALTPIVLEDLRRFWFQDFQDEDFVAPRMEAALRWFQRTDEFDQACLAQFGQPIHAIRAAQATADDVLSAIAPLDSALDWMSLVILLDQVPRNLYRGADSRVAFDVFDPIAREVARRAIDRGVPRADPRVRYQPARRTWFYMPLMHAEDLALHDLALAQHDAMAAEVRALRDGGDDDERSKGNPDLRRCRELLVAGGEAVDAYMARSREFEVKHRVIIERFGRYPHRNAALGRDPTPEEEEYLANGGDTFS
ncbi:uncharacterized protein E0L32_002533 [Thyridium curvatum]|uniref:DUF924-domain-containing protein n=1 Tax=Thyridium curvatum TaxID=1093900 RepID=A0A507BH36_9PEZI|nr:uncharacterized protein E0L32_002533 [Thyridium curvatum]TPX18676.1 hypothetical protein E0L32_002533 [Thyridium curvatum]